MRVSVQASYGFCIMYVVRLRGRGVVREVGELLGALGSMCIGGELDRMWALAGKLFMGVSG